MQKGREVVERVLASGAVVYGVTTGFGKFARSQLEPRAVRELRRNLLLSHAIGVGPHFATEVVPAMMLLRAAYAGICAEVSHLDRDRYCKLEVGRLLAGSQRRAAGRRWGGGGPVGVAKPLSVLD